jgi:hypothetical protein
MKIISVYFDYDGDKKYSIMAKVLEESVKKNCPSADFELIKLQQPRYRTKRCFTSNTVKLAEWLRVMSETNDNVIFMDCDMLVLNDLHNAFNSDFDIGYTKRNHSRIPYNGGVVFVKNTEKAHNFIALWKEINDKMYKDYSFHRKWRDKYAGMNQAAFGYIMEKCKFDAKLKVFECSEWNVCREDWGNVKEEITKIVHIKSGLRRTVFGARHPDSRLQKVVKLWFGYAVEAGLYPKIPDQHDYYDITKNNKPVQLRGARRRPIRIRRLRRHQ